MSIKSDSRNTSLHLAIFILVLSSVINIATAKVVTCSPDFSKKTKWYFCTKMAFGKDAMA
jgi:hypothetical protein